MAAGLRLEDAALAAWALCRVLAHSLPRVEALVATIPMAGKRCTVAGQKRRELGRSEPSDGREPT